MSEYAVVVFVAENSVECIPSAWLDVGKANVYWPLSVSRDKVIKYIKNKQHPDKSWHLFAVRIICYAGTLEEAQVKADQALYTSNVETEGSDEEACKRPVKRPVRFINESNTVSDDSQSSPVKKKKLIFDSHLGTAIRASPRKGKGSSTSKQLSGSSQSTESLAKCTAATPASRVSPQKRKACSTPKQLLALSQSPASTKKSTTPPTTVNRASPRKGMSCSSSMPLSASLQSPATLAANSATTTSSTPAVLKVLKCVEGLRYDVQQLTKQQERLTGLLQQLVDNRPVNDVSVVPPEFDFELPVDTKANLMELEQKLQQKQQLHSLVLLLAAQGGSTVTQTIRFIMSKVLRRAVCLQYSFFGKKGKLPFCRLNVCKAVLAAIHRLHPLKEVELQQKLSKYLAESGDREGHRKRRSAQSGTRTTDTVASDRATEAAAEPCDAGADDDDGDVADNEVEASEVPSDADAADDSDIEH